MRYALYREQRGVSLSGLLMWAVVLVVVAIFGMKLVPVYIEHAAIGNALVGIVSDENFKDKKSKQIRASFGKRARVDNISVVSGKDIEIKKENKQRILEINYLVTIPLFANYSLLIEFNATSH